jgi:uncharacterized protein involved in outer membrane biogenesis
MPERTPLQCFVGDLSLQRGTLQTRTLLADTGEALIGVTGDVDLRDERLDLRINTKPKHFTIGSLHSPIDVTGTLKKPAIGPAAGPLAARGGIAAALGILAAPLALLPTIQLGTGDTHECSTLVAESERAAASGRSGKPSQR